MKKTHFILTVIVSFLAFNMLQAQKYKLRQGKSKVDVQGTSTIHDWEISCDELEGDALIKLDESHEIIGIENLNFKVIIKGMDSGKGLMDNKTYDALKEEEHPNITYSLTDIKEVKLVTDGSYSITAEGTLKIAGITKKISNNVLAKVSGNEVVFSGTHELDMTTYDIEPPTAMMGTIKTGKEVAIKFKTTYSIN